jgi:hypothetical protein
VGLRRLSIAAWLNLSSGTEQWRIRKAIAHAISKLRWPAVKFVERESLRTPNDQRLISNIVRTSKRPNKYSSNSLCWMGAKGLR